MPETPQDQNQASVEDTQDPSQVDETAEVEEAPIVEAGPISRRFAEAGWEHEYLGVDHLGVEILKVDRDALMPFANALYDDGFNYLQCQGGYDAGPGEELVSMYHLLKVSNDAESTRRIAG